MVAPLQHRPAAVQSRSSPSLRRVRPRNHRRCAQASFRSASRRSANGSAHARRHDVHLFLARALSLQRRRHARRTPRKSDSRFSFALRENRRSCGAGFVAQRRMTRFPGSEMKIGTLAQQAGLNASAIRYYEKIGLLPTPSRSGGQRRYSSEALDRVLLIRFASEMGFSLDDIRVFLSGIRETAPVGPRWKKLASRKILDLRELVVHARRLEKLMQGLSHCHCSSLHECVQRLELSPNRRAISKQ